MLGKRKAFRVKGSSSVKWSTQDLTVSGEAEVINSSITGLAITIYKEMDLPVGGVLNIEPTDKLSTTIRPGKATIVWVKRTVEGQIVKNHCGIHFIK